MLDSPNENAAAPGRFQPLRAGPLLFLLVVAILFCRQPGAILHPTLCAEDGNIFFKQQYEQGLASALGTHYAGYLQFVPRLVAAFCALFPIEYVAAGYAVASLLIAAAVLAFFFAPGFRPVIADDRLRAVVVLLFALMPNAEPLMKLSYLSWYMLFATALVCVFALPKRAALRWLFFIPVVMAAWSNPLTIVCGPLFLLRVWRAKDRGEKLWWLALVLAIIGFSFTAERVPAAMTMLLHERSWKWALLHALGYRVFCFFFLSSTLSYPMPGEGWPVVMLVSSVMAGICVFTAWRASTSTKVPTNTRWLPVILLYLILALPVLFVLRKEWWRCFLSWNLDAWIGSDRYFFCSTLLLCVFCGVIYERILRAWLAKNARRRRLAGVCLACWLVLHSLGFKLREQHTATDWPQFARQIRAAETRASQTGVGETLRFENGVADFDFDLLIKPASVKHD